MTKRSGIFKKLLIGVAVFIPVAVVAWVFLMPAFVRNRITALTGCPVSASVIRLNPFAGTVRLVDFRLHNPANFPVPEFVDLALLDIDVALLSLNSGEIHVPRAIIDLRKVTLVTAKDGTTNAAAVRQRIESINEPESKPEQPEAIQKFRIDELVIRLGSIDLVDYSRGTEPVRRTVLIKGDHRFKDVTDLKVVVRPVLADLTRANAGALLGTFGGLLPEPFRDTLGGALDTGDAVKKLIDSLQGGR